MKKMKKFRLWRYIQNHDVVMYIYVSFAFVLALTGILTGCIFMALYQKNYVRSYTKLLTSQGRIISNKVSSFEKNKNGTLFQKYAKYIDELERAENTDVWILSKKDAKEPLSEKYINAEVDEKTLSKQMQHVLEGAFSGKVKSVSNYDNIYGMTTLNVGIPIVNKKTKEVNGAIVMVSMIDRQTMGIHEGKYIISLSVLLSLVICLLIAIIFSRSLSKPLKRIGKRISILAGGDYSKIVVKKPNTQIGLLEMSLDELSAELRKTAEEREELEQIRRDFFANVSHELRTPITVMRGYTETLCDGVIDQKDKVDEMYQRMLHECKGMERLVEDLFILSKMQNPDFKIDIEPVSLVQIFGDILRSGKILGKEKNIEIISDFPEDDYCIIMGDYGRLRQMFLIFVDNAIKFSDENSKIDISIQQIDNQYKVSIRDYGVGISEEQLPYIFKKFYTSKMRQNQKGTGLGLMIAKQIAIRHNSDIQVESQIGQGTTFWFLFEKCDCMEDAIL